MSLHLTLSTPCPATASLRGWQPAGMSVEFLYEGSYGLIELHIPEIRNQLNKKAESLTAIDSTGRDNVSQQHKRSGRYRRNNAVPK
ncbi:MAG TPA: hypothetical protein V6D37_16180 [Candidatus Sericytochromatia bacterium]